MRTDKTHSRNPIQEHPALAAPARIAHRSNASSQGSVSSKGRGDQAASVVSPGCRQHSGVDSRMLGRLWGVIKEHLTLARPDSGGLGPANVYRKMRAWQGQTLTRCGAAEGGAGSTSGRSPQSSDKAQSNPCAAGRSRAPGATRLNTAEKSGATKMHRDTGIGRGAHDRSFPRQATTTGLRAVLRHRAVPRTHKTRPCRFERFLRTPLCTVCPFAASLESCGITAA